MLQIFTNEPLQSLLSINTFNFINFTKECFAKYKPAPTCYGAHRILSLMSEHREYCFSAWVNSIEGFLSFSDTFLSNYLSAPLHLPILKYYVKTRAITTNHFNLRGFPSYIFKTFRPAAAQSNKLNVLHSRSFIQTTFLRGTAENIKS